MSDEDALVLKVLRERHYSDNLRNLVLSHAQVQRHLFMTTRGAIRCGSMLNSADMLDLIRVVGIESWLVEVYLRMAAVNPDVTHRARWGKISIRESHAVLYKSGALDCLREIVK